MNCPSCFPFLRFCYYANLLDGQPESEEAIRSAAADLSHAVLEKLEPIEQEFFPNPDFGLMRVAQKQNWLQGRSPNRQP